MHEFLFKHRGDLIAGCHIILDAYGAINLDNVENIEKIMVEAAKKGRATILNVYTRKFEPQGSTTAVICSESHITSHVFPEYGYAAFDIFLCANTDPFKSAEHIVKMIDAKYVETKCIPRGEYILDNWK